MIDSGILSGVDLSDDPTNLLCRAVAYEFGIPLQRTSFDFLRTVESLADEHGLDLGSINRNFRSQCEEWAGIWPELLSFSRKLERLQIRSQCHFPHPLYRNLKDHYAVRVFELALLLEFARRDNPQMHTAEFILEGCGFSLLVRKKPWGLLVAGPLFIEEEMSEGVSHAYFNDFSRAIDDFNDAIRIFHSRQTHNNSAPSLYTNEYLLRIAFSRNKLTRTTAAAKLRKAERCLDHVETLRMQQILNYVTPVFFSKLTTALVASNYGTTFGYVAFKRFANGMSKHEVQYIELGTDRWGLHALLPDHQDDTSFKARYATASEASFQNWNIYVAESLNQLRNWLAVSRIPGSKEGAAKERDHFGRRLARFLAFLFNAFECTIYRRHHTESGIRLRSVGTFSAGHQGEERQRLMQAHMDQLTAAAQNRSISYRCALRNEVQYCQYFDYSTMKAIPENQPITFPEHERFKHWGKSACAIPIRVNGRLWGTLQLSSGFPHAFPEIVRARAEEASGLIGSYLFRIELLDGIYEINRVISDLGQTSSEKKSAIERTLAQMFGAKTFAIIRVDADDPKRPINVFLEAGRSDLMRYMGSDEERVYFQPFADFLGGDAESWGSVIGTSDFRKVFGVVHKRKFYDGAANDYIFMYRMRWALLGGAEVPGVAVLTFDHLMVEQENWRETIEFICQYVSTITASLYSSAAWEESLRDRVCHELTKTSLNLQNSVGRLQKFRQEFRTKSGEHVIPAVIGDLNRHADSLKRYVRILTTHRDISDFDNDPRLYIVQRMKRSYGAEPGRKGVSFKASYNSTFIGQEHRLSERGIGVPRIDSFVDLRIDMDEFSLTEVLTTLADNVIKYTKAGTELVVKENETDYLIGFTISNIGPTLDHDEVGKIFDHKMRGWRAEEMHPNEGAGLGLWYAQAIMHHWNCGVRHQQRRVHSLGTESAWHDFVLGFAKRLILK